MQVLENRELNRLPVKRFERGGHVVSMHEKLACRRWDRVRRNDIPNCGLVIRFDQPVAEARHGLVETGDVCGLGSGDVHV